jgi:hypothetical protein
MTGRQFEALLLGARPRKTGEYSPFTNTVMAAIKRKALLERHLGVHTAGRWSRALRFTRMHKPIAVIATALVISFVGLSGYAYANGTDPLSLIKRWIVGEEVHVEYQGRKFQYGSALTYSDAAVSAFAEFNFVGKLAFEAGNAFTIPRDGVEHVSDPFHTTYVYPWVGTVVSVDDTTATLRKQFVTGDKVSSTSEVDETIQVPLTDVTFYINGRSGDAEQAVGKLVVVHQQAYMRYRSLSKEQPLPVVHKFAFVMTHSLDEIKEAEQSNKKEGGELRQENHRIFETDWGGVSDICMNNGANRCAWHTLPGNAGEGLYECRAPSYIAQEEDSCAYNADAVPFGEGLPDDAPANGNIMRSIEGKIARITETHIQLRTTSGQLWELGYDKAQRQALAKREKITLKVGDTIGGSLIGSVYDLDRRTYDHSHIYGLSRYKKAK